MAKLPTMRPRLTTMRPPLAGAKSEAARSQFRRETIPWRRWYDSARWKRLRWSVLVRDLFTCQRCGRIEGDPSKLVADHKTPHRGDEALFWDSANLICLCASCHSGPKQREERRLW